MKLFSNKISITIGLIVAIIVVSFIWLVSDCSSTIRTDAKQLILSKLISLEPLPIAAKVDVVYILGGNQVSLLYKYKTVADLYKRGLINRIWVLSRDGYTEYSPSLRRNLSNDEWSLVTLKNFGVPEKKIEIKKVNECFFGTYSEAKDISEFVIKDYYNSILLISSPYHTRRLKESFLFFLKDRDVNLYILASKENVFLRDMVAEYFKLRVYQLFLLK